MKLLSRLFGKAPAAPAPEPAPPPPAAAAPVAAPALPSVDPAEHEQQLRAIESGTLALDELVRLAVDGPTTRLRQAAAARVDDPARWQDLLPRLRVRDKEAYKLIKQRSDALLEARRQAGRVAEETSALCSSLERHATRAVDAGYATTLSILEGRWLALPADGVDAALRGRGEHALARCRETLAAHQRELARLAAERAAAEEQARARDLQDRAEREAAAERAATEARTRAEADAARLAEAAATAQAADERRSAEAQAHAEIGSLIRLGTAALQRGDSRKAARFRQSLEEHLPAAATLPPPLARGLEQFDARLNELRQWKDYVAAPKRIELIEEMEVLVGVDEPPESLAEHIRALRQEWRTLNKGVATLPEAEAERFEQAFQAAFKPCQAHFAAQAAQRRENLEARKRVLERLAAFEAGIDAAAPDHAMIGRVLREAPQEWRSHAPVDRDAARPLEAEFHRGLDRLRTRIDAWHARNAADKQALIDAARKLAALPEVARAVDEAKRLQAGWKSTGPVPHAQSQALWEEFRAACNAVFERRQQAFAAQAETLGQARAQAEALCAQVEQAAGEPPADRSTGEARLLEWRDAFDAIGELPRAEARGLQLRFQRAMARYEGQLADLERREVQKAESRLEVAIQQVRAYQRAVIEGAAGEEREARRGAAEEAVASLQRSPGKGLLQALRQGLARADAADFALLAGTDADRERQLRRLCIRAEIYAGSATPPEDLALRRELELQLLSQGLGQARQVEDRDREAMRLEWLGIAAITPAMHEELQRRFLGNLGRRR